MTLRILLVNDSMNTYLSKCRGAEVFLYAVIGCITQKSFEQARHQPPICAPGVDILEIGAFFLYLKYRDTIQ